MCVWLYLLPLIQHLEMVGCGRGRRGREEVKVSVWVVEDSEHQMTGGDAV